MTAATGTEQAYDVMLITQATETFRRARLVPDWNDSTGMIADAFWGLCIALKRYRDIRLGIIPAWLPGLPAGPEAAATARQYAAEGAQEAATDLIHMLPACGIEGGNGND